MPEFWQEKESGDRVVLQRGGSTVEEAEIEALLSSSKCYIVGKYIVKPWSESKSESTPQLLSMKECSGKKVQKIKVAQNDPLDSPS